MCTPSTRFLAAAVRRLRPEAADSEGGLRAPASLTLPAEHALPGPVEIAGERLSVVGVGAGQADDLASGAATSAWRLEATGMAQPVAIYPDLIEAERAPVVGALVAAGEGGLTEAALVHGYADPAAAASVQPNPTLWLTRADATFELEAAPGAEALIAVGTAVLAVATQDVAQCEQSGRDCSGYAPGVAVFDVSAEPQRVAQLPFPELPVPAPDNPNELSVRWSFDDRWSLRSEAALTLDASRIAFVAHVELSCDSAAECEALGVEAVPFAQAAVAGGGTIDCPPNGADPDGVPGPAPTPQVYGTGQREYFYVLDLAAAGGPVFQSWGVSLLAGC